MGLDNTPSAGYGISDGRMNTLLASKPDKIVTPAAPVNIHVGMFFGNHFKIAATSSRNLPPA